MILNYKDKYSKMSEIEDNISQSQTIKIKHKIKVTVVINWEKIQIFNEEQMLLCKSIPKPTLIYKILKTAL